MRYAVISDIHGNLEALEAVLEALEAEAVDGYLVLGDLVGYGANPNEVVERIRALKPRVSLLGNHDAAVLNPRELEFFNPVAREALLWTRRQLTPDHIEYLRTLRPAEKVSETLLAVHSSPYKPESWIYIFGPEEARWNFRYFEEPLCLFGHSHIQGGFVQDPSGEVQILRPTPSLELEEGKRYLLNPGSVGQPRDYDPRAAFAILDLEERRFSFRRVEYDIALAAQKILSAGLSPFLAERLKQGY